MVSRDLRLMLYVKSIHARRLPPARAHSTPIEDPFRNSFRSSCFTRTILLDGRFQLTRLKCIGSNNRACIEYFQLRMPNLA